jgi:hypothetical protein
MGAKLAARTESLCGLRHKNAMEIKTIWFGCNVMWSGRDSRSEIAGDGDQDGRKHGQRHRDRQAFSQTPGPAFGKDDEAGGEERQPGHDRGNLRET